MNDADHPGETLDWFDAKRAAIVALARGEIGPQVKGSARVTEYWRGVLPAAWSEQQIRYASKHSEWCGVFALWCLNEVLGTREVWHVLDGQVGFVNPLGLPFTRTPKPGDIAIRPVPFWHHAIVSAYDGVNLSTVDGNQPDCRAYTRPIPRGYEFYSIDPLLERALKLQPGAP
jgi:hypothetical protein